MRCAPCAPLTFPESPLSMMTNSRSRALFPALFAAAPLLLVALGASGCQTSGVGEPCVPQAIPADGYKLDEIVIETTSVSCRTRVCLVDGTFAGNPANVCDENGQSDSGIDCEPAGEIRDSIYCSCRCDAPANLDVPTCSCPGGFTCQELSQGGSDSTAGSYCVRSEHATADGGR